MKNSLRIFAWLAAIFLSASATFAQATIAECEKIQAADAYNQCLAKFGPPAKSGNIEPERPGDVKAGPEEAAATAGKARVRGRSSGRHYGRGNASYRHGRSRGAHASRGGRKHMTIPVAK